MEKIKPFIDWLKKNKFWVGSALLSITMLVTWVLIAMNIDEQTEKHTRTIKDHISKASAIKTVSVEENVQAHPNDQTIAGMKELLEKSLQENLEAWQLRYEAQQKILQWPPEVAANQPFMDYFSQFDPPETYPDQSGKGLEGYSSFYYDVIGKQMERIVKDVLNAKWEFDPKYRGTPMTAEEELARFAVQWDRGNQQLWRRKLREFRGWDNHDIDMDRPVPLQIYMLQQDLWLLEAMFAIIREVNGDVKANDLAKIKRIDHIAFGREVGPSLGSLTPVFSAAKSSSSGAGSVPGMTDRSGSGPGGGVEGIGLSRSGSNLPFHNRYVSPDFKPLSADAVQSVLKAIKDGTALPNENLELVVARRVPVRIALRMDERAIPEFMSASANSPFAFEIQQVRKNRHKPGEGIAFNGGDGGGATRMGPGAGMEMGQGRPEFGGDPRGGGGGGGASGSAKLGAAKPVETRTNYDIDVEFFGVVKIYNPPAEAFLRRVSGLELQGDSAMQSLRADEQVAKR